ncbi:AAA family ATPase [Lactobacillus sp. ESL0791]|uniref:guanylate kinase n=1 Tax=Lactobacillus sp. ESL0791 TaxID=2983234 RepID=UPI0023F9E15C|nr:AAA family ATPase [Lactobacillus sp. ESL0791]MDF7639583.1 AAA family ATPase [Lactobacillus sp. ESL0791]
MLKIILIAGPSGAGKTTISEYLTKTYAIPRVITHTTRPMRTGETQNKSYYFESNKSFAQLHFFEHVTYGQYQYGSSREALRKAWQKSAVVSLIVDIKGAEAYLQKLGSHVYFLYVTVSHKEELEKRLLSRGDDPKKIKERLTGSELNVLPEQLKNRAHILLNNNWKETKSQLSQLVAALQSK